MKKSESMTVKDSGKRQEFNTGSRRDTNRGKLRTDLLPSPIEMFDAAHLAMGAIKYGDRNWEKGQPITRYYESLRRHILYWSLGATDENHLAAARWNLMAIQYTLLMIRHGKLPKELDDRPEYMMPDNPIGSELLEDFAAQAEAVLKSLEKKISKR